MIPPAIERPQEGVAMLLLFEAIGLGHGEGAELLPFEADQVGLLGHGKTVFALQTLYPTEAVPRDGGFPAAAQRRDMRRYKTLRGGRENRQPEMPDRKPAMPFGIWTFSGGAKRGKIQGR